MTICRFFPAGYLILKSEMELASREFERLIDVHISADSLKQPFTAEVHKNLLENLSGLTFIEKVEVLIDGEVDTIIPFQSLFERASVLMNRHRKTMLPMKLDKTLMRINKERRKESTYLMHGLHPYKGKFHPQIPRAILNILGAKPGNMVLDPFSGCGTTNLECHSLGINSIGIDLNPLACFISEARINSLSMDPRATQIKSDLMINRLKKVSRSITDSQISLSYLDSDSLETNIDNDTSMIPNIDKWFEPAALTGLFLIKSRIDAEPDSNLRKLFRLVFSGIVKEASNWDPNQVRPYIRKKKNHANPIELFTDNLKKACQIIQIYSFLKDKCKIPDCFTEIIQESATDMVSLDDGKIDYIVTSPPYANAIPYLETDRLRSIFLDLFTWDELKVIRRNEIGNREILSKERSTLETELLSGGNDSWLSPKLHKILKKIHSSNQKLDQSAFRRRNRAALLYKYFKDMNLVFGEFARVLKPGGICAMVVGNNEIRAGNDWIVLETDSHLKDIAIKNHSFEMSDVIKKEITRTSHPRKIYAETILLLKSPN